MIIIFGILVDKVTGLVIDKCVYVLEDGSVYGYKLRENEIIIEYDNEAGNPISNMNKAKWLFDTEEWIDTEPLPPEETPTKEPNKMEVLEVKVDGLETTQVSQDELIVMQDQVIQEIMFTILPSIQSDPQMVNTLPLNKNVKGINDGMATYIALKILNGNVTYEKAFSSSLYLRYQDDVNGILTIEGREDLILR